MTGQLGFFSMTPLPLLDGRMTLLATARDAVTNPPAHPAQAREASDFLADQFANGPPRPRSENDARCSSATRSPREPRLSPAQVATLLCRDLGHIVRLAGYYRC